MSEFIGYTNSSEFRTSNKYVDTQRLFQTLGLTDEVENRTPTVGVNVAHLARMNSVQALGKELTDRSVNTTILGISTAEGPADFEKLLHGLGSGKVSTIAVDISNGIFSEIEQAGMDEVSCLQRDARNTGIGDQSQDIVLRDHIGNCCPPEIDRAIDAEASRLLKEGGVAIVNITTSDLLTTSEERETLAFRELLSNQGEDFVKALQGGIYDLQEVSQFFPEVDVETLRGKLIEIEPGNSFVVFGEDSQGHGEWFRTLKDHQNTWNTDGFDVVEIATREGKDSHNPPLQCVRHNVMLRKRVTNTEKNI